MRMISISKSARLLGLIAAGGSLVLWANLALTLRNDPGQVETAQTATVMGLVAIIGVIATLFDRPILMVVIFMFSFFPVGLYMLGVPSIYRLIGVFDLLYLVAGMILLYYRFQTHYKA